MVVSSVTPLMPAAIVVQRCGSSPASAGAATGRPGTPRSRPRRGRDRAGLLVLGALVDEQRRVAAVVEDHVRALRPRASGGHLLGAPPVLLERLALPGEDRHALGVLGRAGADHDGGGGVVLGGEDVARRPADLGAQRDERLDQHRGLDRHVQRAGDARALQRLGVGVLAAGGHQAGHLVLGELDLLATELGQGEVGDLEVALDQCGSRGHAVSISRVGGCPAAASSLWCLSCSQRASRRPGPPTGAPARRRASPRWPHEAGLRGAAQREADPGPSGRASKRSSNSRRVRRR